MTRFEAAALRVVCFFAETRYPPTRAEVIAYADTGTESGLLTQHEVADAIQCLIDRGVLLERGGRVTLASVPEAFSIHEARAGWFPRKWRRAQRIARYLLQISSVRFVALCNTTALAHARDESDLDFFLITQAGTVWQTRGFAMTPFALLGRRPVAGEEVPDAVCFSFFVDETALDLSTIAFEEDDPYLRYWFLSLLPLVDDGVGADFWRANATLRTRHPLAPPWISVIEPSRPRVRLPLFSGLDGLAMRMEQACFPKALRDLLNVDSRVRATPSMFKAHVQDGRAAARDAYARFCRSYDLDP